MAFRLAEAFVEFSTRGTSTLNRSIDGIKSKTASAVGSLRSMSGVLGTLGVGFGIKSLLGASLEEFAEGERASKRLEAILLATGNTTRFTKQQLDQMAVSIARLTRFEDDQVQEAQAILATYRNLSGDVFPKTLQAATNIAELFGGDLAEATRSLGAALDKPAESLGRLRAANIKFTDEQEKAIKAMAEAGDLAGAQAIIFKELEKYSGLASSALAGPTGAVVAYEKAWAELSGTMGKAIAIKAGPWLEEINKGMEGLPWLQENAGNLMPSFGKLIEKRWLEQTGGIASWFTGSNPFEDSIKRVDAEMREMLAPFYDSAAGPGMPGAGPPNTNPFVPTYDKQFGPEEPKNRFADYEMKWPKVEIDTAEINTASFQTFGIAEFSRAIQQGLSKDPKREEKELIKKAEQADLRRIETNNVLKEIREKVGLAKFG